MSTTNMLYYPYMTRSEDATAKKALGNKLLEAREKLGLTQAQVAKEARVSVNYYARVERGEDNLGYIKLNRVFKVLKLESLID